MKVLVWSYRALQFTTFLTVILSVSYLVISSNNSYCRRNQNSADSLRSLHRCGRKRSGVRHATDGDDAPPAPVRTPLLDEDSCVPY